jgi:hypothetical protein
MNDHVALVSEVGEISPAQLSQVAAALQKQVARDFGPIWQIQATVDAFPTLRDVPLGYWPIVIREQIDNPKAAGYHKTQNGQPLSLVKYSEDWALTCSHECLEMLADPSGDRLQAGHSPHPEQGRVQFLVEVCDPSEDGQFAYTVNGVTVSDFYTPHYFDPVANPSVRYSFTGSIETPRQVLPGGYLSWLEPRTQHLWQETWFEGTEPVFVDQGGPQGRSLREFSDSQVPLVSFVERLPSDDPRRAGARAESAEMDAASEANETLLTEEIEALLRSAS